MSEIPVDDFFAEPSELGPELLLRHRVDVVLVTHDGARWLPRTLAALRGSGVQPDAVHVLDTGSIDGTATILADAGATVTSVASAPREQAYGVSLAQLIDALPEVHQRGGSLHAMRRSEDHPDEHLAQQAHTDHRGSDATDRRQPHDESHAAQDPDMAWIWVIHDDSAPAADALAALLRVAEAHPDTAVLGCKSVGWNDSSRLQDVGLTMTGTGHRNPRVERGERDQGQYIESEEVLAVGSAGMLIRRDVWQTLAGMRPLFPFYRDDIDFCWRAWEHGYRVRVVPQAEIAHREAATHGVRSQDVVPGSSHRIGREVSLTTAYIHARPVSRPFILARLVIASLTRAFVYFVGKDPRDSSDELLGLFAFLRNPRGIMREIQDRGVIPVRAPRRLRPNVYEQAWHAVDLITTLVVEKVDDLLEVWAGSDAFDVIDVVDDVDDADVATSDEAYVVTRSRRQSFLAHVWKRPGTLLFVALFVLGVLGTRNLWGSGTLQGGGLLPVEGTAGDLMTAYFRDWHRVGMGSDAPAAPWMPLLAGWSLLFLGNVPVAVMTLLVLAVPMAGLSAHLAARPVLPQAEPRAFFAAAYALLPALLVGIANGRLGITVLAIALPAVMRLAWRCDETWRRAGFMAMAIAFTAAWVPVTWLFFALWALASGLMWRRERARRLRLLFITASSWLLLFPASMEWLTRPSTLLRAAGADVPGANDRTFLDVLLLQPGGPTSPVRYAVVGFVLAAAAALLQRRRARRVVMGWMVVLVMFTSYVAVTLVTAWLHVADPATGAPLQRWAGPFTLALGLVLLVVVAEVADGLAEALSKVSFGWRHLVASALALAVALAPAVSVGSWILRNGEATVTRTATSEIPAFVLARASNGAATRVLVLHRDAQGTVRYTVFDGGDAVLGDADVARNVAIDRLGTIVASMLSGRDRTDAQELADLGITYVVAEDGDSLVSTALDGAVGLRRLSGGATGVAATWEVQALNERAAMLWLENGTETVEPLEYVVGDALSVRVHVDAAQEKRIITIAEADGAWKATLGGRELADAPAYRKPWKQAWVLPAGAKGELVIEFQHGQRLGAVSFQLLAFLLVLVVALPTYRPFADIDPEMVPA